jgi:hypothetical protein
MNTTPEYYQQMSVLTSEISTQELMTCAEAMRASSQSFSGEDLPQIEGLTAIKIENFAGNSANSSRSEQGSNHRNGQKIANSNFESTEVFNAIYLHATDLMKTLNNSDLL